jgi:multidrug efflux system membrane fusion protein
MLALFAVSCKNEQQAAQQMPPPMVTTAIAVAQDVPFYLEEPVGRAVASESVTIQPQVTGMLMARNFEDGADVSKGCTLFEIDKRPFEAQQAAAKATLLQNQAELEFAKSDFDRVEHLTGTSAVSQQEWDQKKNAVDVAAAKVKAGEAAVETAKLNLDYCDIHSPIEGRTGHRLVDVGNVVWSSGPNGGTNMLTIQKIDPIYVDFTITESDLTMVRRHMAEGTLKVLANLPQDNVAGAPTTGPATAPAVAEAAAPATQPTTFAPREGELIFLDNAVQDGTGTVQLRALVPNKDRHFWPGQFVHVRLVLTTKKDAVLIPYQAAQISQKGPYVYVVKHDFKDGKPADVAELRPIVPGQRHGEMLVINSGVAAGENVVVTGQLMVQPNGPVTVAPPMGGPPGAPAAAKAASSSSNDSVAKS